MKSLKINRLPDLDFGCREAINALATNLMFCGDDIRKILFTSSHASEGKSFLTLNTSKALAQIGKKVVLVDCDLRKSVMHSRYDIAFEDGPRGKGVSHYLAGMVEVDDIIYSTNIDNFYMVPTGRDVRNPLSLFSSPRMNALLEQLQQMADYIIIDAPPVLVVSDAAQLGHICDGVMVVVSAGLVRRHELMDCKNALDQAGCNILGTVLNESNFDSFINRNYYHRYYYHNYSYSYYYANQSKGSNESGAGKSEKSKK